MQDGAVPSSAELLLHGAAQAAGRHAPGRREAAEAIVPSCRPGQRRCQGSEGAELCLAQASEVKAPAGLPVPRGHLGSAPPTRARTRPVPPDTYGCQAHAPPACRRPARRRGSSLRTGCNAPASPTGAGRARVCAPTARTSFQEYSSHFFPLGGTPPQISPAEVAALGTHAVCTPVPTDISKEPQDSWMSHSPGAGASAQKC